MTETTEAVKPKRLTKRVLNGLREIAIAVERELSSGPGSEWVCTMDFREEDDAWKALDWIKTTIAERDVQP